MSYTTTIIEKLVNKGNYYYSDVFGGHYALKDYTEDLRETLEHLPVENLKTINNHFDELVVNSGEHDCTEFIDAAASKGYLKFDPYVVKEPDGQATLVLRWNRFVHLFRGYHYQVSYTFNGIGEYQVANVRADMLVNKYRGIRDSRFMQILMYVNCISACTGIDAFTETLQKHPEVIDDFVASSTKRYFDHFDITYKDVKSCIVDITNKPDTGETPLQIFHMYKSQTMDICRLSVYTSTMVDVEFSDKGSYRRYRVTLPDWRNGLDSDSDAITEDATIYDEDVAGDVQVLASLVGFALNSIGIVINFNVAYPVYRSDNYIKAINKHLVKELDNLDAIYKLEGLGC